MDLRLVVVAAVLAVAACSSSTDGTGSQAEPPAQTQPAVKSTAHQPAATPSDPGAAARTDPCSLVTQAEADAIAGTKLMPKSRAEQLCTFATPTTGPVGQLEVYVGDGAKKFYDIDKISLKHPFQDVPDVGDEAHIEDGAIFVATHNTWFGLRLLRLDDTDTRPAMIQLAKTVVGRF